MTVVALDAKRCRDILHHELPLIGSNVLEDLNVLELEHAASARSTRGALRRLHPLRSGRLLGGYARAADGRNHERRGQDRNREATKVTCDHANPPEEQGSAKTASELDTNTAR